MADTDTENLKLVSQQVGANENSWGDKANANFEKLDAKAGDTTTIATTGGTTTLTETEERVAAIKVTGALLSAATIALSGRGGMWVIENATTLAFSLTVKVTGQTGVTIEQGKKAVVWCNKTDIVKANNEAPDLTDASLPGNPTTTTQSPGNNTTRIATTAFVKAAIDVVLGGVSALGDTLVELYNLILLRALIDSPEFTGNPKAPTPTLGDNDTSIATTAFVTAAIAAIPGAGGGFEPGMMMDYAGSTEPSGWLFCAGQSLLRASYPDLFTAINTTYGSVDGTHFTLPDCRGRVTAGQDDMNGASANRLTGLSGGVNGDNLGAVGGEEAHQLTVAELAAHAHTAEISAMGNFLNGAGFGISTGATSSAGGDTAHNNVQPTIIVNKIIYTGV